MARIETRIEKILSANREKNLRGKDRDKDKKTCQHAEKKTSVARSEKRTRKTPSARQEKHLRDKDGAKESAQPVNTPRKAPPWQGVNQGERTTGQHTEKRTFVARSEPRTRKNPSARQENNLRGTDGEKANEAPTRKPSKQPRGNG